LNSFRDCPVRAAHKKNEAKRDKLRKYIAGSNHNTRYDSNQNKDVLQEEPGVSLEMKSEWGLYDSFLKDMNSGLAHDLKDQMESN